MKPEGARTPFRGVTVLDAPERSGYAFQAFRRAEELFTLQQYPFKFWVMGKG